MTAADSRDADASDDPYVGRVVAGRFRLDARIGAGGVGTVYGATHLDLERPVAVKVLRASLAADPKTVARFTREARLASALDHPNIARVYDYGTEPDGLTYLVMELLDGPELATVLVCEAPLGSERIVELLSQVLSALGAAHREGIVHRDLKPENVMLVPRVDDDGTARRVVKVADFGVARVYGEAAPVDAITRFGAVSGTPEYMSPEQCLGEELDGRSDLYAVGVILYEAMTGRVPFMAESPFELLERQIHKPVVAPSSVRADVDARLEPVALKALAKHRADRYADAAEMRAALRDALTRPPGARAAVVAATATHALAIAPTEHAAAHGARASRAPGAATAQRAPVRAQRRLAGLRVSVALVALAVPLAGLVAFGLWLRARATSEVPERSRPAQVRANVATPRAVDAGVTDASARARTRTPRVNAPRSGRPRPPAR